MLAHGDPANMSISFMLALPCKNEEKLPKKQKKNTINDSYKIQDDYKPQHACIYISICMRVIVNGVDVDSTFFIEKS